MAGFGSPCSAPKLGLLESPKPYSLKERISLNVKIKNALQKKMLIVNQLGFSCVEAQAQYSILQRDDAMGSQRLSAPTGKKAGTVLQMCLLPCRHCFLACVKQFIEHS